VSYNDKNVLPSPHFHEDKFLGYFSDEKEVLSVDSEGFPFAYCAKFKNLNNCFCVLS